MNWNETRRNGRKELVSTALITNKESLRGKKFMLLKIVRKFRISMAWILE